MEHNNILASAAAVMGRKGGKAKVRKGFATLTEAERKALSAKALAVRWSAPCPECAFTTTHAKGCKRA